ncbi:class I SAM-dependent methyltransferase [Streptomyces synnematoformans]|uniref:Methyltransferase domain-containing protein n=1 Tax=Streptomyces synnematoformans TaxID=415721 RepID=A0ABP5JDU3_9ACTN
MFRAAGARDVLELGAGHGRDALFFAREGFTVQATDFSPVGLEQLRDVACSQGVDERVATAVHDVREPLALPDASVDAVFAHMLLCMALSTKELHALVGEVRRVLRPGGTFVYTVRHTGDAHYGAGTAHGDDIYEHGGFAVHFFGRDLVDALADGWTLNEVHADGTGLLCVTLLLRLRARIADAAAGTVVHVIATDPAAPLDLPADARPTRPDAPWHPAATGR